MKKALILGIRGFLGSNLAERLSRADGVKVAGVDVGDGAGRLETEIREADIIYNVAGVNRPLKTEEFEKGNTLFMAEVIRLMEAANSSSPVVLVSSVQAVLDNPYGISKKKAEKLVEAHCRKTGARAYIYRLTNVFGKWSRPNYNSVVATFCHNIARGLPIAVSDPKKLMEFVYIDDVVDDFAGLLLSPPPDASGCSRRDINRKFKITLGGLAERITAFGGIRDKLTVPDFSDDLNRFLYATYLSYHDPSAFAYKPPAKTDHRGTLVELLKSPSFGQIFISRSHKGVTRGNHYHNTKIEKFCVVSGKARIDFRHIVTGRKFSFDADGADTAIVDIPPGYTHSITNVGDDEMVVLFWADAPFDPGAPDTYFKEVQ